MEKINARYENERGGVGVYVLLGLALAINAFNVGYNLGKHNADVDQHTKDIQRYNGQIASQLAETTSSPVTQLILDEQDHFTFKTTATDGNSETCSGEYAVKHAIAVVSGKITCQEITTLTAQGEN